MKQKNTDGLRSELMAAPNLQAFLAANEENFSSESAAALLNELLERHGLSKATLAKQSGMSEIYLHQIFAGRRNPSRSRLLCLCFGLGALLEEAQDLLRHCGCAELYPKVRRDAIIIFGLLHAWIFSPSMTGCSPRTKRPSFDTAPNNIPAAAADAADG